jgi:uncharacterized RDD family membrane protein YckC
MSEGTPPPPPPENPYGGGGQAPPPGGQAPPPGGQPPPPPGGYGAPGGTQPGGYEAAPPPPPYAAAGPRPGELLDRFLARLIDLVILVIVNLVILVPVMIALLGINGAGGFGMGGSFAAGALTAVLSTVIYLGYFSLMESMKGQTVGKMLMKLHVEGANGGKPTLEEAVKRNIWMALPLLGIIPILGGLVAGIGQIVAVILIAVGINNDPVARRPWTDNFAGTRVIKEG